MRIAYGDLIGGISGDMFIAALLDAGLPLSQLKGEISKVPDLRFRLKTSKRSVAGISAMQFQVICQGDDHERSWGQIRRWIRRSSLDSNVKETACGIFALLAEAEAKVHGVSIDKVHFHEVGATDSIVDIVGAAVAARALDIHAFYFSPAPLGRAFTRARHGVLPVPGPATLELLKGVPVNGIDVPAETVTPTGAAIMRAFGKGFGPAPAMTVETIGYGSGQKEFAERPDLFRILIGKKDPSLLRERMLVIETNIDDMNPQHYDYVMDRLFGAGARDVFLSPVQMKKNRPATLLSVICEPQQRGTIERILFQETSTIGVRAYPVSRTVLKRETKKLKTRFGEVTVKIVALPDGRRRSTPEYDDLRRIAAARKLPIKQLHDEVVRLLGG
jgi:pyridinium-3,5-bisthiocarboxylic acid mononucleotide nickel chelatase